MKDQIKYEIQKSIDTKYEVLNDKEIISKIELMVVKSIESLKNGGKIIFCGNGGSFSQASHMSAELSGRFLKERSSQNSIVLGSNLSSLTSIGNDYSFDQIFSRQCESLVTKNDVVIGISTSGNSINVKNGLITAKKNGAKTIGLLGNTGGEIKSIVDYPLIVESNSTARIQEIHRIISHIICDLVEKKMGE